ncbi:MAG: hypothetical protein ACK559_09745, partial [bacterium]
MSPEQALATTPDARSDQFSICVSLWEALYDDKPFPGESPVEVTRALVLGQLPPKPKASVPSVIHAALVRGLSNKPEARFPSMEALLNALDQRPVAWAKAAPWLVFVAGALLLVGWQAGARGRVQRECVASADVKTVWG